MIKILFITRKYPPTIGGMERIAYELYTHLSKISEVKLIKWGGSNKWLPIVLPFFLLKSIWILLTQKIDVIYLQDGLLAPLGLILKIFRKSIIITIYGLDITYKNKFYQFLIPRYVRQLNKIICISSAAKQECLERSIPENKIVVVPSGIPDKFYVGKDKRATSVQLEKKFNISLKDKKIILSVGRLVERKGLHWFIEQVIPKLISQRKDFIYLIAGEGFFRKKIEDIIQNKELYDYIKLLGEADDKKLRLLYNSADIFVMPNIPVEGDMEGLGIVILEAASCGLPVVASNLEGIKDAIKNGKNGFLVESRNADEFVRVINELLENNKKREELGEKARKFTLENYNWDKISKDYLEEFMSLL